MPQLFTTTNNINWIIVSNPINCRLLLRLMKRTKMKSVEFIIKFDIMSDDNDDHQRCVIKNQKAHLSFLMDEIEHFTCTTQSIKVTIAWPHQHRPATLLAPRNQNKCISIIIGSKVKSAKIFKYENWTSTSTFSALMGSNCLNGIQLNFGVICANVWSARQNQWAGPQVSLPPTPYFTIWIIKYFRK